MHELSLNLVMLASLLALTSLCNRSRLGGWLVIVGATVATTVVCLGLGVDLFAFTWIKLYTLAFSAAWLHAMRYHDWIPRRVAVAVLWAVLALNILEAVAMDALAGFWANALCGGVLIASLVSYRRMSISGDDRHLDWPLPLTWIVAYTAWNFAFVSGKYGWHLSDHVIVLGIPFAWLFFRPGGWLQVRDYSLTLYVLLLVTWQRALEGPWPTNYLSSEVGPTSAKHVDLRLFLTAVTCSLVLAHVVARLRTPVGQEPTVAID